MTTAKELLMPYQDIFAKMREKSYGRITLAEALIRQEASHVTSIRNAMKVPHGGWKNKFPLEHATSLGFFIRWKRTGSNTYFEFLHEATKSKDWDFASEAETLINSENVYVDNNYTDGSDYKTMSCAQLISYAQGLMI